MKKIFLFSAVASLLLFSACNRNQVKVVSFSPAGEVNELTTFEFVFNKDLAPSEKLNEWTEEKFVDFDPPVKGVFKWPNPSTLTFSPEVPLSGSQDYKVKVSNLVLFGKPLKTKFETFDFHTPYFDAKGVEFFWAGIPRSQYQVSIKANLEFNYEVDPAHLKDYLVIEKEGAGIIEYSLPVNEPSKIIAINLGEQKQLDKEQTFKVYIKKGMASTSAKGELTEERNFTFKLPPITRLAITAVTAGYDGQEGWIQVFTTQQVDPDAIKRYLKIEPTSNYTVSSAENFFKLTGAFQPGGQLTLKIQKGLPGLYGGSLAENYESPIVMADLDPMLEFEDKNGLYMSRSGLKNLKLKSVNSGDIEVEIYEVFANNILYFLYANNGEYFTDEFSENTSHHSRSNDYDYNEEYYYDDYSYNDNSTFYRVGNYGKLLKKDTLTSDGFKNKLESYVINLEPYLDQRFSGGFVVNIRSTKDYWRRASKPIVLSDIGLLAKRSQDDLMVFANSIASTEALAGIDVMVVSSNNQAILNGKTDSKGMVTFTGVMKQTEGFIPRIITAAKEKDFNYLDLKQHRIETSRYEVSGKTEYSRNYETFIYLDRNLFRPGERVNMSGILRNKDIGIVKDIPVILKVTNSQGKLVQAFTKKLNEEGSFEESIVLGTSAPTGEYAAEIFSGSGELLASHRFSVEEFVPDKIRTRLNADKKIIKPGEKVNFTFDAEFLFGAPAANQNFELDVRLVHSPFTSKRFPGYDFTNSSEKGSYLENHLTQDILNDEGKGELTYELPADIKSGGYLQGTAFLSVFDPTGRTVNRSLNFQAYPNSIYLGIKADKYYLDLEKPTRIEFAAVNGADQAVNYIGQVEVIRKEWHTVLRNYDGNYRYVSEQKEIVEIKKQALNFNGGIASLTNHFRQNGEYEVRLYRKGETSYVSNRYWAYGWRSENATAFEVDKEGKVEIVFDKSAYKTGESAKVLFTTPFNGKMLVTVEREKVMEYQYLEVKNHAAEITISLKDAHLPNFYVTATLFRPHEKNNQFPLLVGHGFASAMVEKVNNKLAVSIQAPDKIKPGKTQEIIVKTNPRENIFVTLALVDEGILQIKNYKTPDPYAYMYAKRRLAVASYDIYEFLLPEVIDSRLSPAGGDEAGAKRQNPIQSERFKLLSFWSGIRRTDASGEIKIQVPIPQFNGEARLMAVAYSGPAFGNAEKSMKIANDVVMMPAIPRVLSPNDSISIPVTLMNTTNRAGKMNVKMAVEGPIKISGETTKSVSLGPNSTTHTEFTLKVDMAIGKGKIKITASGLEDLIDETEISIRPVSPLLVQDGSAMVKAGQPIEIKIPGGFYSPSQNTSLVISKFPAAKMGKHLRYIVGYPHGCLEQTVSKAFPQLYFDDLAKAIEPEVFHNGSPTYFVNEAILKLQGMQRSDGAFSYWPGGYYDYNYWASVYATHFLVEAKKAGYQVQDEMMDKALRFLQRRSGDKETLEYSWSYGTSEKRILKARKEIAYSLYVLALAGKGDLPLMNYYRARPHLLSQDGFYLLAGAYGLMNQWAVFKEILPDNLLPEVPVRETSESFDSPTRALALMLNVLMDVDPGNKQVPLLVNYVSNLESTWYSTQDKCWAFLALGKAAKKSANSNMTVDIVVDGKVLKTFTKETLRFESDLMNGKKITLVGKGTGEVYCFWNTEGYPASGISHVKEEDARLEIRRTFYDRNGSPHSGNVFNQGELYVCKISVRCGLAGAENVAISDLIPSGFEIDNPRLSPSTALNWVTNTLPVSHTDVRDDRMLLFCNLNKNTQYQYHYMVRAVNAGSFILAPIGAEAMYDPGFRSIHGAGNVVVIPRKRMNL